MNNLTALRFKPWAGRGAVYLGEAAPGERNDPEVSIPQTAPVQTDGQQLLQRGHD